MKLGEFQVANGRDGDSRDHIWTRFNRAWKCVTCGAVTAKPPSYPTPDDWMPELGFQPLTDEERELRTPSPATGRR